MSLVVYCHSHVTHKQRSALDIKDIRDNYGLLAVTRMSSSIEHAIFKPKAIMSQRKNVFDSHSETELIVWHRCPLMQVSLYHHAAPQGQDEIHMNLNLTRAQWQVSHSSLTHCNTTVLKISHDNTLVL